jgi:hypothetical protein
VVQDSAWHALTDPNKRNASYICLAISIFNNFSGQSAICMFSQQIFEGLTSQGAYSRYTVKQENSFIGYAAVIGAVLSYFSVNYLTRRVLFCGGHFIMAVLLFLSGFYIDMKLHDMTLTCVLVFVVVF